MRGGRSQRNTSTAGLGDGRQCEQCKGAAVIDVLRFQAADVEQSSILIAWVVLSRLREPREPGTGANVCRLPQTQRDAIRTFSQVKGPPADSLRSGQTGHS